MPGRAALFGSHNLLSGLPPEYSSQLLAKAPTIDLTKGQSLFQIGAPADGCYWLKEGVLKVSITSNQGAERILAILGPGSIVGELAMIDGLPRSASVQALRDSRLAFVSRNNFRECLRDSPELYPLLVDTLVARLRHADEEVAAASFLSLRARVAHALLQFAKHLGEPTTTPDQVVIRDKLRQEDLAALADVARENVSRILSEWRKRKLIVRRSPSVYVVIKSKVEREARGDLILSARPARPALPPISLPPPAVPASIVAMTPSNDPSLQSKTGTRATTRRPAGRAS
jgi:CRP/FNR family transcriptional regulator